MKKLASFYDQFSSDSINHQINENIKQMEHIKEMAGNGKFRGFTSDEAQQCINKLKSNIQSRENT